MRILKELSRKEFIKTLGTKEQCMEYLSKNKWNRGYKCRSCDHSLFIKGKQHQSRRCKKCGYDESPTAHTIFHKLKFGLDKAFEMMYDITTSKKGANSIWLAERYDVAQNTAWLFRQKVQIAMQSSKTHPLEGEVHVDEFEIGTPKKGEQGRSQSEKKIRIVIALEYRKGKCGRGYAQIIEDYSSESLRSIFTNHIKKDAKVLADGWSGYKPLKKEYKNLEQELSDQGRNFPMLHNQIRNFKNWLRGVHSYCDKEYLHKYIDEYFFRFNRRNHRKSILTKLIDRMTNLKPITKREIQNLAT
ncbi:MAG: IS1595 family transposase [Crocinitomix sp.]|nr:IS1595 family transposase [Crocinitomix sp.]